MPIVGEKYFESKSNKEHSLPLPAAMKIGGNLCLLGHFQTKLLFDNQLAHDIRAPCTFRAEKRSAQFFCAYPFAGASELKRLPFDSVVVVEQWPLCEISNFVEITGPVYFMPLGDF